MTPDSMVVEEGVEETRPRNRPTPGWLFGVVGFGLGLALGILMATPAGSPDDEQARVLAGEATQEEEEAPSGITSAIPSFPNALVALGHGPDGELVYLNWPLSDPIASQNVGGSAEARFDSTGQFLATTETVPGLGGFLLSMGRLGFIRPLHPEVTSYAWHDSRSGEIAFTTEQDGVWRLLRSSRTLASQLVVEGTYDGGSLAAWGDWGYAIQVADGEIVLLTAEGEFKDLAAGRALTSHESGWLFVQDDGLQMVSGGGGVRRLSFTDQPAGTISAASFSPDRARVGVAGGFGTAVLDVEAEETIVLSEALQATWFGWSSDSRFVVVPGHRGVFVYDLETGDRHHILDDYTLVAGALLPPAAS